MTSMIVGIDYSQTSPAICVHPKDEDFDFSKCMFFFMSDKPKYGKSFSDQLIGIRYPDYEKDEMQLDRWKVLSDWTLSHVPEGSEVFIEDYAFNAGGDITGLAENCGIMKFRLDQAGNNLHLAHIQQVKKAATGSGAAKKEQMHDAFVEETGVDLIELMNFKGKKIPSPISDIVDAYYICKYGFNRLQGGSNG